MGESLETLPALERLLRCSNEEAHHALAEALWDRWAAGNLCGISVHHGALSQEDAEETVTP